MPDLNALIKIGEGIASLSWNHIEMMTRRLCRDDDDNPIS